MQHFGLNLSDVPMHPLLKITMNGKLKATSFLTIIRHWASLEWIWFNRPLNAQRREILTHILFYKQIVSQLLMCLISIAILFLRLGYVFGFIVVINILKLIQNAVIFLIKIHFCTFVKKKNFREISVKIQQFSTKEIHFKSGQISRASVCFSTLPSVAYASVKYIIIVSGNALSLARRRAITWTNATLLSICSLGKNLN